MRAFEPLTGFAGVVESPLDAINAVLGWDWLTFTEIEGIEPTNNRAELRGAMIYRKGSLGSQSQAGERFAERMLSVSQTCRLRAARSLESSRR